MTIKQIIHYAYNNIHNNINIDIAMKLLIFNVISL